MTCYSVQPRHIFLKGYGFLTFPKNIGKNMVKNISKSSSSKYSQKLLDQAKQYATNFFEPSSKRVTQKTVEVTWRFDWK